MMRIFKKIETYEGAGPIVLSIGNFDGLHRGHQYLLQKNLDLAAKLKASSAVLSFMPHPMQVLRPEIFCALSSPRDQEQGFEQIGIDDWVIEPFTDRVRAESADSFFSRLRDYLPIIAIVVGPDFQFGKDRQGDVKFLQEMGRRHAIDIVLPEAFVCKAQRVSSSRIRQALNQGDVENAMDLLGRPYSLSGIVVAGFQRGQKIGFPTANLLNPSAKNLRRGVYSTLIYFRGTKRMAATNVGLHPTFGEDSEINVESHLLDFNENLYGEEIRVEFLRFIRPEIKFPDVAALMTQIAKDIQIVRGT
jgi:riboflavin kinase/FMN adenylyltransferase